VSFKSSEGEGEGVWQGDDGGEKRNDGIQKE